MSSRNEKDAIQAQLASELAENYFLDQNRGYGGTAHSILRDFAAGDDWKEVSSAVFDGMGSMGNSGNASGPIGAYFHENVGEVIEQVTLAAEVTHFHSEAIAGAIAVALAACYCTRHGINGKQLQPEKFYDFIISNMPGSMVRSKIEKARTLPSDYDIRTIVSVLGNGIQLSAQDTVPFALWCAINHSDSFSDAIWRGVSGLGDRDTIGAIIGSVVVMSTGANDIPEQWIAQTERLWPMRSPNRYGVFTAARSFSRTASTPRYLRLAALDPELRLLLAQHAFIEEADRLVAEPGRERAEPQMPPPLGAAWLDHRLRIRRRVRRDDPDDACSRSAPRHSRAPASAPAAADYKARSCQHRRRSTTACARRRCHRAASQ